MEKSQVGQDGENLATKFLEKDGYSILERNFKNDSGRRLGEIDIIARDANGELVFVEVKSRCLIPDLCQIPEENINRSKLRKLQKISGAYLRQKKLTDANYRFDAISVLINYNARTAKIKHIKNMFL